MPVAYLWKYQYDARAGEVGELEGEFVGEVGSYAKLQESREKKQVDLTPLLQYPAFEELKDKSKFEQFGLDSTIFWSNGADIAPEYLFEHGTAVN